MFAWRALPAAPGHGPGAVLTVPSLERAGIRAAFTGRAGGAGGDLDLSYRSGEDAARVSANREHASASVGAPSREWCAGQQVHGATVTGVSAADAGRGATDHGTAIPDTDALWTEEAGVVCAVLTADCVPLLLADPQRRRLAVVHAGWRGMVAGVIEAAVAAVGASADLRAYVGPSIGPCCYEVGEEVGAEASKALGPEVVADGHLDLWRGARVALSRAGCTTVHPSLLCTRCHPHRFFSHRAGDVARQALIARIVP